MEEQEVPLVWIVGASHYVALQPGAKFKLQDHSLALPASGASTDSYALVRVEHRAHDFSDMPFDGETRYSNDFVCIPAELAFRPARVTARPRIRGPQTATVTDGPDDLGRVKVKFPWAPTDSSGWARVAQSWAFNQMGTQFLPRIQSEVVVEFLDGDPDRPIIVGMVYNGKNKLPYSTPANKTQSGVRGANWDAAGAADKSNELRFEDRAGSEEVFFHAQKDFRRVVKNDDKLTVEQGNRTVNIKMGDVTEKLDMGNYSAKLSVGNHEVKLDAGASKVEAMQSITFKVGSNSITIDQTGVQIKGMMVKIEGQVMLQLKSPMTTVNGDGMLTLKGGITMVN
jgi:type VI secretion system secreted protein VgrG